ncbi:polysaccharide pyruvyl transferase family protein [Stutzerimonas stutzeri]|uniref:polysaccharide pyruvyl transferase family protein n=1 Tax=Stutzerimonas stutzeri TaxID=316 RepID=UPI00244AECAD|nr:polysaccharide pyruvyl transferase family protein [Stutzerimonas stutzeri]MDH0057958.1 polysaccharide pyruvyl transferase family protein [Stutzerimonas stutzeri]
MKIAIMTQPLGHNYGGIMQAWALQQMLKSLGQEVVTIDRQPDDQGFIYQTARLAFRAAMKVAGKRKAPINIEKQLPYILKNTHNFICQNITLSERLDSTEKLKAHFARENYDAVVVGSDQTWRPKYSPNIENFFLDFLEGKKIKRFAYASSFGVDKWEYSDEKTKRCAGLAKEFDAVSVRETTGIELCRKYLGIESEQTLDPTLLLDRNAYENLICPERIAFEKAGVFTYFLDKSPEKIELADNISKITGEKIYSCQARYGLDANIDANMEDFVMPDPRDWLAGFANAKYVLTDSFHGCVFSIIFNKPFIALGNYERGLSRFDSLLRSLDLVDRLITNVDANSSGLLSKEVDWLVVNRKLHCLRANSIAVLNNWL